jgi:hypothetical protein
VLPSSRQLVASGLTPSRDEGYLDESSMDRTARDSFEAALSFFGIAVWRTPPGITSETVRMHGARRFGHLQRPCLSRTSHSARLTFATPRDRIVKARSRLV